ncbi:MAG: AarF/UbiB family protein [Desulfobacterales bacterium]|nr:AarF/UbiB family protein [Desulfobacterales bacterium]
MLSIRKIGVIGRTYRHLTRYRQILAVFFRYGFGDLVDLLKIDQYIEIGLQMISRNRRERLEKLSRPERVRLALEELGPTYVKLGQVLSTRPDLIPVDFITELTKLQDKVPPFDTKEVERIVSQELGAAPDEVFATFERTPLASASIGQVHKATLADGEKVAVKVQRPGIKRIIEVDLEIMLHLATLMENHIEEVAFFRPVKIVEEFAKALEREIDYTFEAVNMERMAGQFLSDRHVYIPKVYRDFTTERVLTAEFIDGIKISAIDDLDDAGLNRRRITRRGSRILLRQIFDFGFFHGDPHPGNLFVLPGEVICLLDFGMVGTVDRQTREDFVDLVDAVVHRQETRTAQVLLKITQWEERPPMRAFERSVADFMGRHLYRPLKEIQVGPLLQNLLELAADHRLVIPPDIFLMMKTLTAVEGVARSLDPEFDIFAAAAPFIKKVIMDRYQPRRLTDDALRLGADFINFMQQLSGDILDITRLVRKNRLTVHVELESLKTMLETHDQISNRLSFAVIIAGLMIGSSIIVVSGVPPLLYGISLIGIIVFITGAVMGLWLLLAIIRKGRL